MDDKHAGKLSESRVSAALFMLAGVLPFAGTFFRRLWGRDDWRKHYAAMVLQQGYIQRAFSARIAEKVLEWHRAGRVGASRAELVAVSPLRFFGHLPLSLLPAGLHRLLTDREFALEKLHYILVRPVRLYFNAELRQRWLREMVEQGRSKHMLSDEDAGTILSDLDEPFIQKYLKSLAVHICTLPVTQVVSVAVAIWYKLANNLSWSEAWGQMLLILAAFQIVPISPGSLVRGLYVVYLVLRDRNFRDYNIAVFLSFFKYIGYLAFPIQMAHHYPALARFMAGHWATEAVHIVPVFGERGALLEHWVFSLFYNRPLTLKRRMRLRNTLRARFEARYWHVAAIAAAASLLFAVVDRFVMWMRGAEPGLGDIWPVALLVPIACGVAVTLGCGGAAMWKRFSAATGCGLAAAAGYSLLVALLGTAATGWAFAGSCAWRAFIFAVWSTLGAMATELVLPEPENEAS